jgi:Ala-tRNA(Pro) deacylase
MIITASTSDLIPAAGPHTPDDVVRVLNDLGLAHTLYHHDAVFTVAEAEKVERDIPGVHCRNLFVRDDKETMFLVSLRNRTQVDLKKLSAALSCRRLSFGSPERLYKYLGVRPGSVCAFAVMNDRDHQVQLILEAEMMDAPLISFHPLINTMTVTLAPADLVRFARHFGHSPRILSFDGLA